MQSSQLDRSLQHEKQHPPSKLGRVVQLSEVYRKLSVMFLSGPVLLFFSLGFCVCVCEQSEDTPKNHLLQTNKYIYIYPGSQTLQKEWSLGELKGNFIYSSQSKYSLWTSRVYIYIYISVYVCLLMSDTPSKAGTCPQTNRVLVDSQRRVPRDVHVRPFGA